MYKVCFELERSVFQFEQCSQSSNQAVMVRGERERGELHQEAGRQFWHDATTRLDARRDCRRLWMRKRRIDPLYNVKQQAVYLPSTASIRLLHNRQFHIATDCLLQHLPPATICNSREQCLFCHAMSSQQGR